jgi:hypothetical protein
MIYTTDSGCTFNATEAQAATLDKLTTVIKGGIATVHDYVATSGRVTPEVSDINFITAFSVENLYKRKLAALQSLSYNDVKDAAESNDKVKALSHTDRVSLFEGRKVQEIASLEKTLSGDRSDAHRQAHDRCYCYVGQGVKVHYVTESQKYTAEDGSTKTRKVPVLTNGIPTADSIMLTILELGRTVKQKGEYKVVNSGASVLIKNAMLRALNLRSIGLKTLSLKGDNFSSLSISRQTFLAEEFSNIPADILEAA